MDLRLQFVAAGLLAAGLAAGAHAQSVFDNVVTGDGEFSDAANWFAGFPGAYPDFGGSSIDIAVLLDTTINVDDLIVGMGGLTNSSTSTNTFSSGAETGTFTFDSSAAIDPSTGAFIFDIDVFAAGTMELNLLAGGNLTFAGATSDFTSVTTISNGGGGTLTSDGGIVRFLGAVTSDAGGHFLATSDGSFIFGAGLAGTGPQTFELGDDGAYTFKSTSVFNGTTTFINNSSGTFTIDSGSIAFNGATTTDAGGHFIAMDGGDFVFNDTFEATGSQTLEILDGGGFTFNGATSFDSGTITATGDDASTQPSRVIFNGSVTNGVDGVKVAAELRSEDGAEWIFNDEYIFFGAQVFSAVEDSGGTFTFNDFAGSTPLLLSGANTFTADGAALTFNRAVQIGAGTTVTATNSASLAFTVAHQSDVGAIYSAQDGSIIRFDDDFNATGNQTFQAGNAESFEFAEAFFTTDAGVGVASFDNATAAFQSATLEDDYDFALSGFDSASVTVRADTTLEGNHAFSFGDASIIELQGDVSMVDDATITIDGHGSMSFLGEVTTGTGTTTFDLQPTAVGNESLDLILGSVTGAVKLGGDIMFTGTSASDDEDATASLAGVVSLTGDIEEVTITADLGTGGVLKLENNALQNVAATLDVVSGALQAIGGSSMGSEDLTVNLAAGTTLRLQSTPANISFMAGELQGDAASTIESVEPSTGTIDAVLLVTSGEFAGTMLDGHDEGSLGLTVVEDEFLFSGTGTYTGLTSAQDGGILVVTGTIDGTSQLPVFDEGTVRIEGGTVAVVDKDEFSDGSIGVRAGGVLDLGKNDEDLGLIGGTLSAEGNLVVEGIFNAAGTSTTSIESAGIVMTGGTFTIADSAIVDFTSDVEDEDAFVIDSGGTMSITDDGSVNVINGSASVAGLLGLSGDTASFTADSLTIAAGGTFTAESDASFTVTQGMTVEGTGTITGPVAAAAETITISDGGTLSFVFDEDEHADFATLTLGGDLMVEEGGTLVGDARFNFGGSGDLKYAGTLQVGAAGSSEGFMELNDGKLEALEGGNLVFGLSYDAITRAGSNAFLRVVDDVADFSENGQLTLDVQGTNYIPTDVNFTLLRAQDFLLPSGATSLDPVLARNSVTRTWITATQSLAGGDLQLNATTTADYLGSDSEGAQCLTEELQDIGNWLNGLIPTADADPNGGVADFLGSLDAVETCTAYETAIRGIQPTSTVSVIHLGPQTQFFDVLRHEIRREAMSEGVGSPVPLRLENGEEMLFMQSDEQAIASTVRRTSRPATEYAAIGRFFGRQVNSPTNGNVIGFDGNEYGGFAGFAFNVGEGAVVGFDLGYTVFSGDLAGDFGTERIGTIRGGPYFSYVDKSGWFVDAALSGGWNHYDFTRVDPTLPAGGSVSGKGDGYEIDFSLGGGYTYDLNEGFSVTPQASFLYSYVNTGTIEETSDGGSLFALDIDPGDLNAFAGRVGVNLAFKALPGLVFDIEGGWQGNFTMSSEYSATIPGTTGAPLPILSVDQTTANTLYYGGGVSWLATWNVGVNLRYAGRGGDGYDSSMVYGGVSISF